MNATIASRFSVRLPKTITLDGSKKSASYKVTCEGDFPGNQKVVAVPDAAVTLSSNDKADVVAPISQDKTEWLYNESNVEGNGSVNAAGITAGDWSGVFNFNISLDDADVSGHVHAYAETITKQPTCTEDGEKTLTCECGDTKTAVIPATGHNYVNGVCGECGAVSPDHTHSYSETVIREGNCFNGTEQLVKYECACGDFYSQTSPAEHDYNAETQFCKVCHAANMAVFSEPGLYGYISGSGEAPVFRTPWVDIIEKTEMDVTADGLGLTPTPNRSIYKLQLASLNPYSERLILVLPKSITSIGDYQFSTYSGTGADMRANKLDYVIGEGVTTVGEYAFCPGGSGNGFTRCRDFYFPKLNRVKRGAFDGFGSPVVLPSTVTRIGENAFKSVNSLYYNGSATGSPWGAYNHYTTM